MEKVLKGEIFRKTIHILAYLYAVVLYSCRDDLIVFLGLPAIIVFLDALRLFFKPFNRVVILLWGYSIKPYERRNLSDATVMAIGVWLCVLIFGKYSLVGLAISIVGDAFASLVGKFFGRIRFKNGKSLEGFLAFNLWALIIALFSGELFPYVLITGIITSLFEFLSPPLENLTLGIVSSFTFFAILRLPF